MKFVKGLDAQDACLIVGVLSLVAGSSLIYRPAGLIVLGLFSLCCALMIQAGKKAK